MIPSNTLKLKISETIQNNRENDEMRERFFPEKCRQSAAKF
jgi:hypothetical protein